MAAQQPLLEQFAVLVWKFSLVWDSTAAFTTLLKWKGFRTIKMKSAVTTKEDKGRIFSAKKALPVGHLAVAGIIIVTSLQAFHA
mmetsp:Transcript_22683/g.34388  ORF Transcript_22683/g.34388 Transcript_22683/m.34388 type:complete len:84 (+) Transcript_22683:309-560(+)